MTTIQIAELLLSCTVVGIVLAALVLFVALRVLSVINPENWQ